MSDSLIIAVIGVTMSVIVITPFFLHHRRNDRRTEEAMRHARDYGLNEPATLHPVVDAGRCIGTAACVGICPEGDVIGIKGGQAVAVSPACCIGHGLCERACPVEAIQLVFGSEKRGVDIPRIQGNYETNVPGLFIVGELGGMGLIRNAFEQGRECVEGIVIGKSDPAGDVLDLLVVGCGPAGLSASISARQKGLRFETVESESDWGGAIRHYPRKKLVMTSPVKLPGIGKIGRLQMSKEDLLETFSGLIERTNLTIRTGEKVEAVDRGPDGIFHVTTSKDTIKTRNVILAIGRRGVPRKLGVTGESLSKVHYSLLEPEQFQNEEILVVGGGDSAVEAALALSEQPGTTVRISYRREKLSRIKPANRERMEAAVSEGSLEVLWSTQVSNIEREEVTLVENDGSVHIPNDRVFVFAGGVLPTPFLEACGVEIDTKFGMP